MINTTLICPHKILVNLNLKIQDNQFQDKMINIFLRDLYRIQDILNLVHPLSRMISIIQSQRIINKIKILDIHH